jgi:hypothetical protein
VLAIKASVVEVNSGSRCQRGCGFLKQVKGASISIRVQVLSGRAVTSWLWVRRCLTGRSSLDSLHAKQGQIWNRCMPSKVRFGGSLRALQVDQLVGCQQDASVRSLQVEVAMVDRSQVLRVLEIKIGWFGVGALKRRLSSLGVATRIAT